MKVSLNWVRKFGHIFAFFLEGGVSDSLVSLFDFDVLCVLRLQNIKLERDSIEKSLEHEPWSDEVC